VPCTERVAKRRTFVFRVVFAGAVIASARDARAEGQEIDLRLELQSPPECPSAETIRAEVSRITRVREGRVPPRLVARGKIDKDGERYRLRLRTEVGGRAGERALSAGDCKTLGREITLLLALAFGEGVEVASGASSGSETSENDAPAPNKALATDRASPQPMPIPTTVEAPAGSRDAQSASAIRAALLLGGGVLAGVLPEPALFGVIGADIGSRRWVLAPRAFAAPRVTDVLANGIAARYAAFGGSLSGCGRVGESWLVAACLGFGAAALRATAVGNVDSLVALAPWYTALAGVSLGWPNDGIIGLRVEGNVRVSLNEPRFVVGPSSDVHRVPLIAPELSLVVVLAPSRAQSQSTGAVARTKSSM
jgi:hypothetical protein